MYCRVLHWIWWRCFLRISTLAEVTSGGWEMASSAPACTSIKRLNTQKWGQSRIHPNWLICQSIAWKMGISVQVHFNFISKNHSNYLLMLIKLSILMYLYLQRWFSCIIQVHVHVIVNILKCISLIMYHISFFFFFTSNT